MLTMNVQSYQPGINIKDYAPPATRKLNFLNSLVSNKLYLHILVIYISAIFIEEKAVASGYYRILQLQFIRVRGFYRALFILNFHFSIILFFNELSIRYQLHKKLGLRVTFFYCINCFVV